MPSLSTHCTIEQLVLNPNQAVSMRTMPTVPLAFIPRFLILSLMLSAPSAAGASNPCAFDPVQVAAAGMNIPPGYEVRSAQPGELSGSTLGHTDGAAKTILIDTDKLAGAVNKYGGSPDDLVTLCTHVLEHELSHTPEEGEPSDPGYPGFGDGPCVHANQHEQDAMAACQAAMAASDPTTKAILNGFADNRANVFNSLLAAYNEKCSPKKYRMGECGALDE